MSEMVMLEDFAAYLKRDLDAFDAYTAQLLLDGAESLVTEYCGWHITPEVDEVVTVDGTGTAILALPTLHLVGLDSVREIGYPLNIDGIDWSTNGLLEKRGGYGWTARRRGVVAGITHGYADTPSWLLTLICSVAGRALMAPLGGVSQESAGGESVSYARPAAGSAQPGTVALDAVEMRMLDRIKVPDSA